MKDSKLNSDHANPVAVVSKNYAEIGSMLASGMVPRDQYYYRFGIVTVVSYYILKEYIDQVRQDWTFHRANFANLAIDCFEYWNSVKNKPRIVDPKGNQIIREMLGEKIEKPKKRIL